MDGQSNELKLKISYIKIVKKPNNVALRNYFNTVRNKLQSDIQLL